MDKIIDITILLISLYLIYIVKNKVNKMAIATLIAGILGILIGKTLIIDVTPFIKLGSSMMAIIKVFILPLIFIMGCTSFLRVNQLNIKNEKYTKYLIFTTVIGAVICGIISTILNVGSKINFLRITDIGFNKDIISNSIKTPLESIAKGNILLILILSTIIGYVLFKEDSNGNNKVNYLKNLLLSIQEVMFSTIKFLISFIPYIVFCIMTSITVTNTTRIFEGVISVIVTFYIIAMVQIIVIYLPLVLSVGVSPIEFIKGIWKAQKNAFITQSSGGTAPILEGELIKNFKLCNDVAHDVPRVGANIGMNACQGIYPVLVTIMVANIFGVKLGLNNYLLIIGLITLLTFIFAGMPGIATFSSITVIIIMGLPIEAIVLATISDIIIDKMRTLTNITGTAAIAINIDGLIKYNKNNVDNCNKI